MARLESRASAGFFPTAGGVLPLIAALFDPPDRAWSLVDPCAGEGVAAIELASGECEVFVAELEQTRFEALSKDRRLEKHALRGDAFRILFNGPFASLLYLNPPYDVDAEFGRLEERWLQRWARAICDGGHLVNVVPYYALSASAETVATLFDDVECFAFPDPEFAEFKQVVLVARRCEARLEPDRGIYAKMERWATGSGLATLRAGGREKRPIRPCGYLGPKVWSLSRFDAIGLLDKARPWRRTSKGGLLEPVPGVMPLLPIADLMDRRFPVASPPRAAHLAAGIASGLFNGRRVSAPGMPDLLIKGVFRREFAAVEEREDEEGQVIGVLEVQRPSLTITTLNLETAEFRTLEPRGPTAVASPGDASTIEGLLEVYGPSLRGVLAERCPVVFDPARPDPRLELAPVARPLFEAQEAAARAVYGLLAGADGTAPFRRGAREEARRGGRTAILLGEIGVGKTSVALAIANTIALTPLVVCPPHLLDGWRDQAAVVTPWAEVRVLREPADVDALAADVEAAPGKMRVAVLSREAAKLGHGREGISGGCPRCGSKILDRPEDNARRRLRCGHVARRQADAIARLAADLALVIAPAAPQNSRVVSLLTTRGARRWLDRLALAEPREWAGLPPGLVRRAVSALTRSPGDDQKPPAFSGHEAAIRALLLLVLELNDPVTTAEVAIAMSDCGNAYTATDLSRILVATMPPGDARDAAAAIVFESGYGKNLADTILALSEGTWILGREYLTRVDTAWVSGRQSDAIVIGSLDCALKILSLLTATGRFVEEPECGEPLFQATPDPRRYPVANYIVKRHPRLFDMLVLDEAHELHGFTQSAQGIATARLSGLRLPTIRMTGSLMNGYAESCFGTMWLSDPEFRADFERDEVQRFIDLYGYRKRLVTDRDKAAGEVVEFGSVSDRIVRSVRNVGEAPGILPLFLFRYLLRRSVTLQKEDLGQHIPPCRHIVELVDTGPELRAKYTKLIGELVARIKKDRFDETGKAGALFGALAQVGTYLDRSTADTGNDPSGAYVIRYPAKLGGEVVCQAEPFPAGRVGPKERWLIETLKRELAEGRNAMVFLWNENLFDRIRRGLEAKLNVRVPVLYADKVPTAKRQSWIDREVVRPGARVLIVNPVSVQTGLNNLVHFATEIFFQDPACNPTATRQGIGRVDRLGQERETRIYFPVFARTVQKTTHDLLLRKIAIATAADGLDPESVLAAAGPSDNFLSGMSLGRQLYAMIEREPAILGALEREGKP